MSYTLTIQSEEEKAAFMAWAEWQLSEPPEIIAEEVRIFLSASRPSRANPVEGKTCDSCGEPATKVVIDTQDNGDINGYRLFKTHSRHYFCDTHHREMKFYDADGNLRS